MSEIVLVNQLKNDELNKSVPLLTGVCFPIILTMPVFLVLYLVSKKCFKVTF